MALTTGVRLGPYEIVAPIGAGGMGEVYRARDTRLDRSVAIKVLPQEPSRSGSLRARFEQEARAISALNHPNICTLHDVGREGETDYLVMELVEGETLADRLLRGRLPLAQVLRYGAEVARGLAQAHRHGIVHRDLKPGNIMITPRGAKILDFGLAKVVAEAGSPVTVSDGPTREKPITEEGTLLGTVLYMAPEQLEGRNADARSDIFALGAILWEMATGRRTFGGKSHASVVASILHHDPEPVSAVVPLSPPGLDRVIRIALRKDPEARWQNADDVALELEALTEEAPARRPPHRLGALIAVALGGLALGALALWTLARPGEGRPLRPTHVSFFPPGGEFIPLHRQNTLLALSPDGRRVAFIGGAGGGSRILVHSLDTNETEALPGTEGGASPFWSPDGTSLGFYASGMLRRIDVRTKDVQGICAISKTGAVADWGSDGTIIFSENAGAPGIVKRVPAAGGTPEPIGGHPSEDPRSRWRFPQFLPDGKHFLVNANLTGAFRRVHIRSLDGKLDKKLFDADSKVRFAPPHWLVYVREGVLMARRLDLKGLELDGDPISLGAGVHYFRPTGVALFDVSESTLVFQSAAAANQLVWVNRDGSVAGVIGDVEGLQAPSVSHDGASVAISVPDSKAGVADIWVHDVRRGFRNRLTPRESFEGFPIWSPDDTRIAFSMDKRGPPHLHELAVADPSTMQELAAPDFIHVPTDWSHDGSRILFTKLSVERGSDVWVLPTSGAEPELLIGGDADERDARFSPDGRWVSFTSDDTGRAEIYVVAARQPTVRLRVSPAGGRGARWNGDGTEIFYVNSASELVSVAVTKEGERLDFGPPRILTKLEGTRASSAEIDEDFTFDPVSGRFLVNRANTGRMSVPIEIVLDWKGIVGK